MRIARRGEPPAFPTGFPHPFNSGLLREVAMWPFKIGETDQEPFNRVAEVSETKDFASFWIHNSSLTELAFFQRLWDLGLRPIDRHDVRRPSPASGVDAFMVCQKMEWFGGDVEVAVQEAAASGQPDG